MGPFGSEATCPWTQNLCSWNDLPVSAWAPPSPPGLQVAFSIRAQNAPSFSLLAKSLVIQVNVTPVFLSPPR